MTSILQGLEDVVSHVLPGTTPQRLEGFFDEDLLEPVATALKQPPSNPAAPGRTVVLIPGFLGSSLMNGARRLWLSPADRRAIEDLTFAPGADRAADHDAIAGVHVQPGGVMWEFYGLLQLYFHHARFDVRAFPFDWRRSLDDLAEALFRALPPAARFSIVAHSMGCLVARRCVQLHRGLVDRIDHAVFLAPPFQGTYSSLTPLAGDDWLTNLYSTLTRAPAAQVIATWPGVLDMVADPSLFPDVEPLLQSTAWSSTPPSPDVVRRALWFAKAFRRPDGDAQIDDDRLMRKASLVIGLGLATPTAVTLTGGKASFATTTLGDDTVLARSAWDDRAMGTYRTSSLHMFTAQDIAVIRCAAALVASSGRDSGGHLDPIPSLPRTQAEVERRSVVEKPSGFDQRQAQGELDNADLRFMFGRAVPS